LHLDLFEQPGLSSLGESGFFGSLLVGCGAAVARELEGRRAARCPVHTSPRSFLYGALR